MLRQRNTFTLVIGLGVWLAVFLVASSASLTFTNVVSAQQSSTASTLSTPTLSAEVGESGVDLSWTAVQGAVRYALWAWTSTTRSAGESAGAQLLPYTMKIPRSHV